ncbi:MAG TPA: outer membrane protein [Pseudolabrys sp.]|nr:outer membrane protein [Pseudolabrys sp.]
MKRQLLVSTAVGLVMAPPVFAADVPVKAPAAAPVSYFSWAGPYVGLHAGYAWSADPGVGCTVSPPGSQSACMDGGVFLGAPDVNTKGFMGGLQLGYNWQVSNNWVFGIETDFSGMDVHDAAHFATTDPNYANAQVASRYDWLGTVRGRAGFAMDRTLIYATGGFAYARLSQSYFDGNPAHSASASGVRTGWTVGAGLQYALDQNWSVKGEYLYVNLQNTNLTSVLDAGVPGFAPPTTTSFHFKNDLNIVRVGLNYRF